MDTLDVGSVEAVSAVGETAAIDGIMQKIAEHKGCGTSGGSGKASCGSSAGQGDLPTEIWEKVKNHPCYSEEAHHHYARMHVAVAPACNIQCNYCNRKYDCANESRPGVVSEKLTPEQAAKKVLAVASTIPQMTVLGIAGPGDPLANPEKTFKTFDLIARTAPDIKLCLSTNGLALPDHVDTIAGFNVDHVTITINMVDPEVGARIESVNVRDGEAVDKGTMLLQLSSPDLDYKLASARSELEALAWQMNARGIDPSLLPRSQVSVREYQASLADYHALQDQKTRLQVTAPIAGHVVDLAEGLQPGIWLAAKERLLSVVDGSQATVEAYIDESDLTRVAPGDLATFHADADDRISVALRVTEVARGSTHNLRDPYLASVYGGPIPVRETKNKEYVPDRTIYRVTLAPTQNETAPSRVLRGTITLRGRAESIAVQLWRSFMAIAVREAGA